jgi:L-threonylcarbamoyladenylate synthase
VRPRSGTDIGVALDALRRGGIVGLPTETVYGLAADADNPDAVRRIFAAKGRPGDHPLIVHIASVDDLPAWADEPSPDAVRLAELCWPGPLTIIVPAARRVIPEVTGGRSTVGLRTPAHPLALELLRAFGGGLAAPSANRFGRVSPTTAQHVLDDLGIAVDYVLDGGACAVGVESTIVDCTTQPPQVLRPGGIGVEDVERLIDGPVADADGPSRAPGMLASHYAPACPITLVDDPAHARRIAHEAHGRGERIAVLDRTDDLVAYAHELYDSFRRADAAGMDAIVAVMPAPSGLGHAIRDRLVKAAAPRL